MARGVASLAPWFLFASSLILNHYGRASFTSSESKISSMNHRLNLFAVHVSTSEEAMVGS